MKSITLCGMVLVCHTNQLPEFYVDQARCNAFKSQTGDILPKLESLVNLAIHIARRQFGRVFFDVVSQFLFRPTISVCYL